MPAPPAPASIELVKDLYWRLKSPMRGELLEAWWPPEDDWMPAKFVKLPEDGRVEVKWVEGGSTSELPSHYVRVPGSGVDEHPSMKRYLRAARPDWKDNDLLAVTAKLKAVGILESKELYDAVVDEMMANGDGINVLLKAHGQKCLVPRTLEALRLKGECLFSGSKAEPQSAVPDIQPEVVPTREELHRRQPRPQKEQEPEAAVKEPQQQPRAKPRREGWDAWREDSFLQERVCCSRGHKLKKENVPYDANCEECGREVEQEGELWRCDRCAYDLCIPCHLAKQRRLAGFLPEEPKKEPRKEPPPVRPAPMVYVEPAPVFVFEDEPEPVHCPKGHLLKHACPRHIVECNYCGKEQPEKQEVWSCNFCSYHLCDDCHADKALG